MAKAQSPVRPQADLMEAAATAGERHRLSVGGPTLNVDAVFEALTRDRDAGTLAGTVTTSALRYQASRAQPGYLEQHRADGHVAIGLFRDGQFIAVEDPLG